MQDKAAEAERQNQTEKQGQLEQKLKDLNADLKAKNKSIKDLEKEVKSLGLSWWALRFGRPLLHSPALLF